MALESVRMPALRGLNNKADPMALSPEWMSVADNGVINSAGNGVLRALAGRSKVLDTAIYTLPRMREICTPLLPLAKWSSFSLSPPWFKSLLAL